MDWLKDNIIYALALIVTATWVVITFVIIQSLINKSVSDLSTLLAIYATVTGAFTNVIGYWFSTTKSSKDKDETIKSLTQTN